MSMRNSLVRFLGGKTQIFTGTVASAGVVISNQSGDQIDRADVTSAATATGVRTLTIKNVKGTKIVVMATAETISVFASRTSASISSGGATVVIKTEDDTSAATNSAFDYLILTF